MWEALEQRLQADLDFHSSQGRPQAGMYTGPERRWSRALARVVSKAFGWSKTAGSRFAPPYNTNIASPARIEYPWIQCLRRRPADELHGGVIAQDFLDGIGPALGVRCSAASRSG